MNVLISSLFLSPYVYIQIQNKRLLQEVTATSGIIWCVISVFCCRCCCWCFCWFNHTKRRVYYVHIPNMQHSICAWHWNNNSIHFIVNLEAVWDTYFNWLDLKVFNSAFHMRLSSSTLKMWRNLHSKSICNRIKKKLLTSLYRDRQNHSIEMWKIVLGSWIVHRFFNWAIVSCRLVQTFDFWVKMARHAPKEKHLTFKMKKDTSFCLMPRSSLLTHMGGSVLHANAEIKGSTQFTQIHTHIKWFIFHFVS